jgi:hypothetical protein
MSEVTSVNGQTGAVVLTPADVGAVAASEAGQPSGVATLNSSGELPEAQLPGSVVTSSLKALGSVSGIVKLDLAEATTFMATLTGATEFEVINAPARPLQFILYVMQDATGGYTWSVKGVSWVGSEPIFKTTAKLQYVLDLESLEGGAAVYANAGLEGPKGERGLEGPKGERGETGARGENGTSGSAVTPVLLPIVACGSPQPYVLAAIGTANRALAVRCIVPKTGKIKDISVWNGTTNNGNTRVAIFDTGDAATGKYTLLKQSAAVAQAGENKWQSLGSLEELEVTAGKEIVVMIMNSGTTGEYGLCEKTASGTATAELPESYLPVTGGALPKLKGAHTFSSGAFETITEAQLELTERAMLIIGRIE